MIKDTVIHFVGDNTGVFIPACFIAQECDCTSAYVIYLARKLNWEIKKGKYGKILIRRLKT